MYAQGTEVIKRETNLIRKFFDFAKPVDTMFFSTK